MAQYPDENSWWNTFTADVKSCYENAPVPRSFPDGYDFSLFKWYSRIGFSLGTGMPGHEAKTRHLRELEQSLGIGEFPVDGGPWTVGYPDENSWWNDITEAVKFRYLESGRNLDTEGIDFDMFKWYARTAFDIGAGLSPESSKTKHFEYRGELKDTLGYPRPVLPSLQGRLRLDGNGFMDDNGPALPRFSHSGDLLALFIRNKVAALKEMDDMREAGFHGFRYWTLLGGPYWESKDRHVGPKYFSNYWPAHEEFVVEANSRQLKLVCSQGDINQAGYDMGPRKQFAAQLANMFKRVDGTGFVCAFFDGGNEAWQTGEPDPARLAQFVQAYRDAGGTALLSLTSAPGELKAELDEYSIAPADVFDVHGYRGGNWWDKIRHIFSIAYEGDLNKRYGIQSEPPGGGDLVSVTENKHELDDESVTLLGIMSLITRQAWVWFSGEGVRIQAGLHTQPGFRPLSHMAEKLPKDVMSWKTMHHSGQRWASTRILVPDADATRIDGIQHPDGRFVQLIYGPSGEHKLKVARSFTGTLYNPATLEEAPVTLNAGQTFTLTYTRGRVLIGRFI